MRRKLRKRRRGFLGGGVEVDAGPVDAVPVPVGGRVPVMGVAVAGGEACALGEVRVVCAGLCVTVAWMGPRGTPAVGLSSAYVLYTDRSQQFPLSHPFSTIEASEHTLLGCRIRCGCH